MIQQTIDELRALKRNMIDESCTFKPTNDNIYTLDKAIIACEQLRKARKKAKRWKKKYLELLEDSKVLESDFRDMWNLWVSQGGGE